MGACPGGESKQQQTQTAMVVAGAGEQGRGRRAKHKGLLPARPHAAALRQRVRVPRGAVRPAVSRGPALAVRVPDSRRKATKQGCRDVPLGASGEQPSGRRTHLGVAVQHRLVGQRLVADLVQRIGGVGDQLTQEDLLVAAGQ